MAATDKVKYSNVTAPYVLISVSHPDSFDTATCIGKKLRNGNSEWLVNDNLLLSSSRRGVQHPESTADTSPLEPQFPRTHRLQPGRDALLSKWQAAAAHTQTSRFWRSYSEGHLPDDVTPVRWYLDTGRKQWRAFTGLSDWHFTELVLDRYWRKWWGCGLDCSKQTIVHRTWNNLYKVYHCSYCQNKRR